MNMILTLSKHVIALMFFAGFSASAVPLDKFFDFDTSPDIPFWNSTGAPDLSVISLSGGFMEQRTLSVTESVGYAYPNWDVTGGGLSPTSATVLEARMNVLRINGSGGVFFQAFDGAHRYSVLLAPTGVNIITAAGLDHVNLNVFGFHTYRLESPANSPEIRFYYDGELVLVTTALAYTSANGFNFGDGVSPPENGGDVTWDYAHFYQTPSLPFKLTVVSSQGGALPGTIRADNGTAVNQWVTNSPVVNGSTRYLCAGGAVEGNAYSLASSTNVTVTLTNNATLTWNWQTQYRLETLTEGAGTLTPASEWLDADASVTLTATPDSGWVFDGWTGDTEGCAIDGNTITVAMTRARGVTAQFDRDTYAVTFDPEGGAVAPSPKSVTYGLAYGALPAPTRLGFAFGGWWTGDNGTGTQVTEGTAVTATSDHALYALWAKAEYLCPAEGDAPFATAGSYDGYFYSDRAYSNGVAPAVRGVLTLRITGLSGKLTAKAMMRKGSLTFNRAVWRPAGADGTRQATLTASGGETLVLQVRQNRIWGTLAGGTLGETLALDGARNRFADRADAEAQTLLSGFRGYYTVALPAYGVLSQGGANAAPGGSGYLTLTVGGGGRVVIAGVLADGTPVTQFANLILFDGCGPEACVALFDPLYSRKGGVGGLLWIDPASRAVVTDRDLGWLVHWEKPGSGPDGFGELLDACGGFYGTVPALASHYLLTAKTNAVPYAYGGPAALQTAALPDGIGVALDGPRLSIARGTRPVESGGAYDYSAENSAMASFAFTARTGIFRGRFNLYYDYVAGGRLRHASVSVPYAGVLTPVRGDAFADEPSGQGYYLVPDNDPAVKSYRLQRSFLIELDAVRR